MKLNQSFFGAGRKDAVFLKDRRHVSLMTKTNCKILKRCTSRIISVSANFAEMRDSKRMASRETFSFKSWCRPAWGFQISCISRLITEYWIFKNFLDAQTGTNTFFLFAYSCKTLFKSRLLISPSTITRFIFLMILSYFPLINIFCCIVILYISCTPSGNRNIYVYFSGMLNKRGIFIRAWTFCKTGFLEQRKEDIISVMDLYFLPLATH